MLAWRPCTVLYPAITLLRGRKPAGIVAASVRAILDEKNPCPYSQDRTVRRPDLVHLSQDRFLQRLGDNGVHPARRRDGGDRDTAGSTGLEFFPAQRTAAPTRKRLQLAGSARHRLDWELLQPDTHFLRRRRRHARVAHGAVQDTGLCGYPGRAAGPARRIRGDRGGIAGDDPVPGPAAAKSRNGDRIVAHCRWRPRVPLLCVGLTPAS